MAWPGSVRGVIKSWKGMGPLEKCDWAKQNPENSDIQLRTGKSSLHSHHLVEVRSAIMVRTEPMTVVWAMRIGLGSLT